MVKIVDPTSNVYIIVLCPENTLNDTGTTLNQNGWKMAGI